MTLSILARTFIWDSLITPFFADEGIKTVKESTTCQAFYTSKSWNWSLTQVIRLHNQPAEPFALLPRWSRRGLRPWEQRPAVLTVVCLAPRLENNRDPTVQLTS